MREGDVVLGRTRAGVEITGKNFLSISKIARARIIQLQKGLSDRAINAALVVAYTVGGEFWIKVFLIKRFDKSYAEGSLGYRASKMYAEAKRTAASSGDPFRFASRDGSVLGESKRVLPPQDRPFVLTGNSMRQALAGARPKVTVKTNGSGSLKVTVPRGDITRNARKNLQFSKVPANEKKRVAEVVLKAFEQIVVPGILSGDIGARFQKQNVQRFLQATEQREAK